MVLSIKTRMYLSLAILATALLVVGGSGLLALNRTADRMNELYADNLVPIQQIDEVYQRSLQSQQYRLEAYVHRDAAFTQANYDAIKANRARINELLEQTKNVRFSPTEQALAEEIQNQRAALVSIGKQEIDALLAQDYETAAKIRLQQIEPVIDRMDASSERLTESRRAQAEQVIEAVRAQIARERWIIAVSFVCALAVAFVFALRLTRQVTSGLARATEVADRVSRGQLGISRPAEQEDEIGAVLNALHTMDGKLLGVVQSVAQSATEVDRAARQLSEGSDSLSERTQEQAAALEETAASMEEMTATVKQTVQNTAHANQLVTNTRQRADEGTEVLHKSISAVNEISESSRRIEAIIGVIDEIAFQTNLLALNAAVEAARAGEQGRGFAVVAGEVRSLAQRSASAAKEIKQLIGESVERVGSGAKLVEESGEKLGEIVTDVKRVADIVEEVASAMQEQSAGINQIHLAVANMDAATQQNAASVEESAAAAKVLQQQAEHLQNLVSFFSFEGSRHAVHSSPAAAASSAQVIPLPRPAAVQAPKLARASGDQQWREF